MVDVEELLEEGHVGATQWGNAGQILQGYENVRGISQRIDGGVGRIAAICLSEFVPLPWSCNGLYNRETGLRWITLMFGTCCGGSIAGVRLATTLTDYKRGLLGNQ